jgi:hypothetical protein
MIGRIVAILLATAAPALAHGPYEYFCCSEKDCSEVDSKFIRESGDTVHIVIPPGEHPMWPADGASGLHRSPATGQAAQGCHW